MRVLLALSAIALLAHCKVEADFSDQIQVETLTAEDYRLEIMVIDRLVFREEPLGAEGARTLEQTLDAVAKRVRAHGDTKFLKLESMELQLLAKRAGRIEPGRTGFSLQNDWMRIRNNLFDDRAWFARSARDLEEISPPEPKPAPVVVTPAVATEVIESRNALTGRWKVVSMTANGELREDDELTNSIWSFDPPRLTMRSPNGVESTYNFTPEGNYLRVAMPGGEEGWMRYELAAGALRVAFYDGLGAQPPGFESNPAQKGPLLVVVQLAAIRD